MRSIELKQYIEDRRHLFWHSPAPKSETVDYVDLYFIIKDRYSIKDMSTEANRIFGELFSEKLFREQMAFHEDIDYSEPVEYLPGFGISDCKIRRADRLGTNNA